MESHTEKNNSKNSSHPVWDVYDFYRTAKCHVMYYSIKLNRCVLTNSIIEIILAGTTSSSAVAALWLWNTPFGKYVWQVLLVISALLAIAKPSINLTERIRKYEEVLLGYRALEHDLMKITVLINQSMKYEKIHRSKFLEAIDRKGKLIQKIPEIKVDENLIKRCRQKVEEELPAENFFIPRDTT